MKILLLVTIITWSFAGGYQYTPQFELITCPEDAAVKIYYETKAAEKEIEPDHKTYRLYEIALHKNAEPVIKEIPIPKMNFEFKDSLNR